MDFDDCCELTVFIRIRSQKFDPTSLPLAAAKGGSDIHCAELFHAKYDRLAGAWEKEVLQGMSILSEHCTFPTAERRIDVLTVDKAMTYAFGA